MVDDEELDGLEDPEDESPFDPLFDSFLESLLDAPEDDSLFDSPEDEPASLAEDLPRLSVR